MNGLFIALSIVAGFIGLMISNLIFDIRTQQIFLGAQVLKRSSSIANKSLLSRIGVFLPDRRKKIESKFKELESSQSIDEYIAKKYLKVLAFFVIGVISYIATKELLIGILAIAMGIFMFYQSDNALSKMIRLKSVQHKIEIPVYIRNLLNLMATQTGFDALSKSVEYAPPSVKPLAAQLVLDISQYPNGRVPYNTFAEKIGLPEVNQLMLLLYQAIHLSETDSKEYLEKLYRVNEKLEDDSISILCDTEPSKMEKYSNLILFCMVSIPMSMAIVTLFSVFKDF